MNGRVSNRGDGMATLLRDIVLRQAHAKSSQENYTCNASLSQDPAGRRLRDAYELHTVSRTRYRKAPTQTANYIDDEPTPVELHVPASEWKCESDHGPTLL